MGQLTNNYHQPLGYVQVTALTASTALSNLPTGIMKAWIQAQGAAVRWRDDGAAPTASVGMIIADGDILEYTGDLSAIRFIQSGGTAALNISYYG